MIILNPITRQSAAKVISETLNANYTLSLQKRIMNDMLWAITCDSDEGQINGIKYSQAYWSTGAIERRNNNIANGINRDKGLRHEHLVPKNLIRNIINNLNEVNEELILQKINQYNHAVIVSIEEDNILRENGFQNNLPNDYDIENYNNQLLFSRYIESEIPLFKVQIDNHIVTNEYDKLRFENNTFEIIDD
jgi:hypothetical protein